MSLKLHQPHQRRYCKALIFSPAGHGKTTFLGSAQEDERTYPMLFLDFESGYESLSGLDIDVAPIRSWRDADEALTLLKKGEYKSVGIDSISEWHKWALLDILEKAGPSRRDPDSLEQRDYGKATVQLRRQLRKYRDLPMHVFYAAHSKDVDEPRTGRIRIPDMAGQMAEEVAGLVSVCGYMALAEEEGEQTRILLMRNYPKYRVKARSPWNVDIPDELEDPDVTSLLDILGYED